MHEHDHDDADTRESSVRSRKLALVAVINLLGFVLELVGSLLFGSVVLLSDAMHMLFDMLAYAMAFSTSYTAERSEGSKAFNSWYIIGARKQPILTQ